jgi:curli biogenesis system outer membrane secretion channel CsgG
MRRLLARAVAALAMTAAAQAWAAPPAAPFEGLKKTISVDQFEAADAVGGTVTADGLTAMLVEALARDGRFVVVERPGLASVQAEQALGTSGSATAETSAKTNQMIGASVIVRGAVTKYQPAAGGGGLNLGGLPMGSMLGGEVGLNRQQAVLVISLRLIDTTTGQVISTASAEGRASSNSANATLIQPRTGAMVGGSAFANSPIGKAAQDAIVKAVVQIDGAMRAEPWSALVVDDVDGKVYVNAGADRNLKTGTQLGVYHKGKVLTDPGTGAVLDVEMAKIGVIQIDAVRDKLSTATLVSGAAPARGDLLKLD